MKRTRHIEMDCHFIRDKIQDGSIVTKHVAWTNQLVDVSPSHWERKLSQLWYTSWEFLTFTLQLEGECWEGQWHLAFHWQNIQPFINKYIVLVVYLISCLLYLDYQEYISMIVGNLLYKVTSLDSVYSFEKENILFPFFYTKAHANKFSNPIDFTSSII